MPQLAISEHFTVNLHKSLIGAHSFNFARHRQLRQHAVGCWCSVFRLCKPLSLLSFTIIVFVVLVCVVAYFLFSEGKGDFLNSILSGWERWKLFCKLCPVLGLVGLANVLTPVRRLLVFVIDVFKKFMSLFSHFITKFISSRFLSILIKKSN